jgi:transforming growth factor-beta-induced protein
MIGNRVFVAALAVATLGVGACSDDEAVVDPQPGTIVDVARSAGSFTTLLAALDAAGLTATLEGDGPFTVFAPTDEAFDALPAGTVDALLQDPQALASILTYHVVSGRVEAAQVVTLSSAETLNGASVSISVDGSTVKVDDATVVQTDIAASNGVIHVIDAVILPPAS